MTRRLQITYTSGETHLEPTPRADLVEQVIAEWNDNPDVAEVVLLRPNTAEPRIEPGPVTVTLTGDERLLVMAALASLAQELAGMKEADAAWLALQKVSGVEDVRALFGIRPRTRADLAQAVADCEMQLAMRRVRGTEQ